jgi:hypothetical protein
MFCGTVRPFLFHSWWHILSGLGTYIWIQFAVAKHLLDEGERIEDEGLFAHYKLPFGDVLPFVGPIRDD